MEKKTNCKPPGAITPGKEEKHKGWETIRRGSSFGVIAAKNKKKKLGPTDMEEGWK